MPVLTAEPLSQDLDQNGSPLPLPAEYGSRQGQPAVLFPAIPVPSRDLDTFFAHLKEVSRRDLA